MNIDFHYAIIYVVSRLAGLEQKDAQTVAHACQYIDDATTSGVLEFQQGQSFERFATAHSMFDYRNFVDDQDRMVWAAFHFLPGAEGNSFEELVVCRPDSRVAREMVRRFLASPRFDNRLHALGVLLHTYVDTWAHQGFSGIISRGNRVSKLESLSLKPSGWLQRLRSHILEVVPELETQVADHVEVGHGAALHWPDLPWAKWTYTNGFDEKVERENLPEFMKAAQMAYKVVRAYREEAASFVEMPDLSDAHRALIEGTLGSCQSQDEQERVDNIAARLTGGQLDAIPEPLPGYVAKGPGSWKSDATGIDTVGDGKTRPLWTPGFETSDYRKFHDAVKQHRIDVAQFLLPTFGIRLA